MINVNPLFSRLYENLIQLLHTVKDDEWNKPTLCPGWSVKDIATHMLDGQIRRLSMGRDGYYSPRIPASAPGYDNLLNYLNDLNRTWVEAATRMSPRILVEMLETIGKQYHVYMASLDPEGPAIFSVAWAGESKSQNWMDVARDYTEQWVHQQQIREALKKPAITTEEFYRPVLDIWMLALPYSFRTMDRPNGTSLELKITGDCGGIWYLIRLDCKWLIDDAWDLAPNAKVRVHQKDVWKVLAKNYRGEQAMSVLTISGDEELASHFADVAAVMA